MGEPQVGGRAKIIVDGGFLRGADVCKGICAGADLVAVGRLVGLGLAAGGEEGLTRAFDLLLEEVHTTMGLMGVPSLAGLVPEMLEDSVAVGTGDGDWIKAAFPLLASFTGNYA
jgi:isopentenyl diphosphate isomerase/L-lactate dehydrogenase-like FMN-dependent dehydrogenase